MLRDAAVGICARAYIELHRKDVLLVNLASMEIQLYIGTPLNMSSALLSKKIRDV